MKTLMKVNQWLKITPFLTFTFVYLNSQKANNKNPDLKHVCMPDYEAWQSNLGLFYNCDFLFSFKVS